MSPEQAGRLAASRLLAIGLGANLPSRIGEPAATLAWAGARLGELLPGLRLAPLYRTAPISHLAQPDFFNTVALAPLPGPAWTPRRLLGAMKALEAEAGRSAAERNAPRALDLDLLFFGELASAEGPQPGAAAGDWPGPLTLPHPRLRQRLFVLAPLRELAPDLALPPDGRRVAELCAALGGDQQVARLEPDSV